MLTERASDSSSSDLLRQRVPIVICVIEEATKRNKQLHSGSIPNAIFDAFRPDVPALNEKALFAVQAFPPQLSDGLVTLAVVNSKDVAHCLRLLDAVELCNQRLQPNQHVDLFVLTGHVNPDISSRAWQLVRFFRRRHSQNKSWRSWTQLKCGIVKRCLLGHRATPSRMRAWVQWERRRKQNHWFDALYNACAAGHYCGVRLVEEIRPEPKPKPKQAPNPQREPYIDIERWRANQKRIWGNRR